MTMVACRWWSGVGVCARPDESCGGYLTLREEGALVLRSRWLRPSPNPQPAPVVIGVNRRYLTLSNLEE
jgi:hypothetical protein